MRQALEESVTALQPVLLRLFGLMVLLSKRKKEESEMIVEQSQVIEYSPMKISQEEEKMCLIGLYGHQNHLELLNEGDDRDCIIAYWNEQLMNDMQLLSVASVILVLSIENAITCSKG